MKKHALTITALTALISAPLLSKTTEEPEAVFTITPKYVSTFMDRGVKLAGPSLVPTLEFEKGPWSFELFGIFPLTDEYEEAVKSEFDFTGFYKWELGDRFSISTGLGLFAYPNATEKEYKFIAEPVLSFAYKINDLTFSANVYYDLMQKGPAYEFGVDYSIPLASDRCQLELSALVGRYDLTDMVYGEGEKVGESGDYYQAGIAVPIEFSKHVKLTVGWYYEKGANNCETIAGHKERLHDAVGQHVFHAGFSFIF